VPRIQLIPYCFLSTHASHRAGFFMSGVFMNPLFLLGDVVATPAALNALQSCNVTPAQLLQLHVSGNWGSVCEEDAPANDAAVHNGERILSSYRIGEYTRVWVITEWDCSVTTLLLPSEY
jgi:hypothetical protein